MNALLMALCLVGNQVARLQLPPGRLVIHQVTLPKRELAVGLSTTVLPAHENPGGPAIGLTYTRNVTQDVALEAIVDVGRARGTGYDTRTWEPYSLQSFTYGYLIGQVRYPARLMSPEMRGSIIVGMARALAPANRVSIFRPRSFVLGWCGHSQMLGRVALRADIEGMFSKAYFSPRASMGVAVALGP
jgi:hypothetical protein